MLKQKFLALILVSAAGIASVDYADAYMRTFACDGKTPSDAVEACVRFYVADGTVWIDGFRVEEISETRMED